MKFSNLKKQTKQASSFYKQKNSQSWMYTHTTSEGTQCQTRTHGGLTLKIRRKSSNLLSETSGRNGNKMATSSYLKGADGYPFTSFKVKALFWTRLRQLSPLPDWCWWGHKMSYFILFCFILFYFVLFVYFFSSSTDNQVLAPKQIPTDRHVKMANFFFFFFTRTDYIYTMDFIRWIKSWPMRWPCSIWPFDDS